MRSRCRIEDITLPRRIRKDFGDIQGLASSIKDIGLLQPVVITGEKRLLVGVRRVKAYQHLGEKQIPVHVVETLTEAVRFLKAERDENVCRKEFTASEYVALGEELEELEKPTAKVRQQATQAKPGEQAHKRNGKAQGSEKFTEPREPAGQTRDKVASALGISGPTYEKAKAVVAAGKADPEQFGDLLQQMDETGKVDPAFKELQRRQARAYQQALKVPITDADNIRVGDFRTALTDLLDGSVDLIFTDPPYDKNSIHLYQQLGELAARVLCEDGSLVCYAGQYALFDIPRLMTTAPDLRYQ
jgi:hypothetical protein